MRWALSAVRALPTKRIICFTSLRRSWWELRTTPRLKTFNLKPFFENLGAPLATHRDIRYAKTILLIGGEPEELQPLTGKQIRQAVRNGGAKLIVINSVPIRLVEQSAQFIHIRPGTENAAVLALAEQRAVSRCLCERWVSRAPNSTRCGKRLPIPRAIW